MKDVKRRYIIKELKHRNLTNVLIVLSIFLIGTNLRAPLTSVGTLIGFIRDDLGMTNTSVGVIMTLPLIVFALLSPLAPKIAQRFGIERTMLFALIVLLIGILVRPFFGVSFLFIGTALIGVGISFGNVLMPSYIKLSFPLKIGIVMGVYAFSMNLFSAIFAGISVPIAKANPLGWQGSLVVTSGLTLAAIFIWLPRLKKPVSRQAHMLDEHRTSKSVWTSKLAWHVTLFMGFQSIIFYTIITWLPEMMIMSGFTAEKAGWIMSIMQFLIIPLNFIVPVIAGRLKDQKMLSLLINVSMLVGVCGLLLNNASLLPLFTIVIGLGSGSAFSLAMMYFTLRTSDAYEAAHLSGMAQFFGYLVSAVGPVLFGFLFDLTGNWTAPVLLLVFCSVVCICSGFFAGEDDVVHSTA